MKVKQKMWKLIVVYFFLWKATFASYSNNDSSTSGSETSSSLLDCSFRGNGHLVSGSQDLMLNQIINPDNQTVSIELIYGGLAWIGIAFVESPSMVPSIAVIGLPDDGSVAKYDMTERSDSGVTLITDATSQAAITDSSIKQNATHTILKFTKPLIESGEVSVLQGSENLFIWAYGTDNSLGYHALRGSDSLVFDECVAAGTPVAPVAAPDTAPAPVTIPVSDSSPVATPVAAPVAAPVAVSGKIERNFVLANNLITMNIVGDAEKKLLTVEMTYAGLAWISFAISQDGLMTGSTAIIGLPSDATPVVKYDMTARSLSGVTRAPDSRQVTLTDTALSQNGTHTYMKFTKPLVENGDISVLLDGSDNFLYAYGSGNTLAIHQSQGSFVFAQCDPSTEDCGSVVESEAPNRNKWIAHGICMALSWAILIPLGIGSSLIRNLLPSGGVWFQIHRALNVLGILLTVSGFAIAVNVMKSEGGTENFAGNRHQTLGLVITIFALVQGVNGALRPHAPAAVAHNGNSDEGDEDGNKVSQNHDHIPEKTQIRSLWEMGHRIFGLVTLGLAWYNCDLGYELFETRFGDEDNFAASGDAFWPVVGSISGLIFVLTIYCKFIQKKETESNSNTLHMNSQVKDSGKSVPESDFNSGSVHM